MGFSSLLMQVVCIRSLLALFSGNELVICITLAVWLASVGLGSFYGWRFKARSSFANSFLAAALTAQFSFFIIGAFRMFFVFSSGEVVPFAATVALSFGALFPLCFVFGMQFPLAVENLKKKASEVYWLEACGAFAAGVLFVFAFSGRVDSTAIVALTAFLNMIVFGVLSRRRIFLFLLILPLLFYFAERKLFHYSLPQGVTQVERLESRYGEIAAGKRAGQTGVYVSGAFAFAYPDMQTEENIHIPLTAHEAPKKILVIGGSPAVVRELLKYPVENIDFIELDPALLDLSKRLLSPEDRYFLDDKRVSLITQDGRSFVKSAHPKYDLLVLNLPEPSTASINRFYTMDFFKEAKAALNKGGMLALSLPASYGYIGKRMQWANGSVYGSLRRVFAHVEVSSEEYGIMLASDSSVLSGPQILDGRFNERGVGTVYFRGELFYDIFDRLKTDAVKERLGRVDVLNTDSRPVAYLYNLMIWSDIHGGGILNWVSGTGGFIFGAVLVLLFSAAGYVIFKRRKAVYFSLFTTGYVSMAFSSVLILGFQSAFGFVYESIGLLSAVFMAGLAAGSLLAERKFGGLKYLKAAEALSALFFIAAVYMLKSSLSFYAFGFLCGIIGGIQFGAAAAVLGRRDEAATSGRLYATDISGSFAGALITALFAIPVLGMETTLFILSAMKLLSLAFLSSADHEKV